MRSDVSGERTARCIADLWSAVVAADLELSYCRGKLEAWCCERCLARSSRAGWLDGWHLCDRHMAWWLGHFTSEARDARRRAIFCE